MSGRCFTFCSLIALATALAATSALATEVIRYNRQIRPLLSENCFQCHGPDPAHRMAGLRLDDQKSATGEAASGRVAVVPGKVAESELISRITSSDPDLKMPPPHSNKTLEVEEIELIEQWINQGAEYQPHWAFIPPKRREPPASENRDWPANAIDNFVLAELQRQDLVPSRQADRIILLRRVSLDLTGLPPTRDEAKRFLDDDSPNAYEHAVDRLLASPRYGEHMARYWLDAVRYGDTHGLHLDNYREMWPYRDWVIRAFNDNVPWDQFTIKQLAGDLLPDATLDDRVASGFNRCHVTTNEGGSIDEEVYVRNVVDRVSTTGTVFLGLTLGCAACHDHKFDPITMRDFYSSFAFFNNMDGPAMDANAPAPAPAIKVPAPQQSAELAELDTQIEAIERRLASPWPKIDAQQDAWEERVAADHQAGEKPDVALGVWHSVGPFRTNRRYLNSQRHGPEGRPIDLDEQFELTTQEKVTWQEQPGWKDGEVIYGFSEQISATFVYRQLESSCEQRLTVSLGTDDGVKVYLNGQKVLDQREARRVTPNDVQLDLPLKAGKNDLLMKIINYGGPSGFYFDIPERTVELPSEVLQAVKTPKGDRSEEQIQQVRKHYRWNVGTDAALQDVRQELQELQEARTRLNDSIPTTLVMKEREEPRPAYLLTRGQYDSPDKEQGPLPRAVPAFLPPLPEGAPTNRLGYAQWLVAAENPLMARVTVNRFWQQCFGVGLVETADDFGSQGAWPSHPELLDWLAVDFRTNGWNVKRLMKQIVMSSTYRQASHTNAQLQAVDPRNRLLARGPRFRLDAEVLRDQALTASGLLVHELGGPGVKPSQPDGLWKAVAYVGSNTDTFVADTGPDKVHRRSVYTFWKRTSPPPQMSTLDAPSRESCVVRRERTNTPLAALLLLNDPQYVEAARKLAERSLLDGGTTPGEVAESMFSIATLRTPSAEQRGWLVDTYEASLQRYRDDPEAAAKLLAVGEAPIEKQLDPVEVAAWTLAANAVLNLDEVLTKE